jgi:hypothetical protein
VSAATPFDWLADKLAAATSLSDLEARGTLRLALRAAGLEARTAGADALRVVIERVLAGELRARGVDGAESLCERLASELAAARFEAPAVESADSVFARLGAR